MSTLFATIQAYLPAELSTYLLAGLVIVLLIALLYRTQERSGYYVLLFLLVWFPLESVILKYTPLTMYPIVKYTPEMIMYTLAAISIIRYTKRTGHLFPANPITRPTLFFLGVAAISLLVNWYSATIWLLGVRQLLRFITIFLYVITADYPKATLERLLFVMILVAGFEASLGIIQYLVHGRLDAYLFSSDAVQIGNAAIVGGIEQFWTPGARAFATMGRYDQLGSFLAIMLIILFVFRHTAHTERAKFWSMAAIGLIGLSLLLTFSRASWIAAAVAIFYLAIKLMHDRAFLKWAAIGAGLLVVYLGVFFVTAENTGKISDTSTTSLQERLAEIVSPAAWRDSYEGYGRYFFIVNTPRVVVADSPFFGVGPGNYGGGVASALSNTRTYDRLKIPFGIEGTYGQIDNSWFAIWGETGTFGIIAWGSLFFVVLSTAYVLQKRTLDPWVRALAQATVGATIGLAVMAFFGPYFEFRTLMMYYWVVVGMMMTVALREKRQGNFLQKI